MRNWCLILLFLNSFWIVKAQDIYDLGTIREVRLQINHPNWHEYLDSLKEVGSDDRLVASLTYNSVRYDSVGIRYKGNSSYFNVRNAESSKLPFNIKVNHVKKEQILPEGFKTLKLSNVFRDPSYLREALSYEIARTYMPSPRANFVRVYVNDTYLGLYNNTESVDSKFLQQYFGDSEGTLVKCDPDWHSAELLDCPKGDKASLMYLGTDTTCYISYYEMKSDSGWLDLQHLTYVLNEQIDSIETVLDIDGVLWMLAFDNVLVNLDSYIGRLCHNYYLYKSTDGQFHPIVWDMNLSFGGFRYDGIKPTALTDEEMQKMSMFLHYKQKNEKRPLVTQLLTNKFYRKIYLAHIQTILEEFFVNGKYKQVAQRIQQQLDYYVKQDENKLYSYESFKQNLAQNSKAGKSEIIGISKLMDARTSYLTNHPVLNKTKPTVSNVYHKNNENNLTVKATVKNADKVWLMYKLPNQSYKRIAMLNDGTNGDAKANDAEWAVTLPKVTQTNYYIIAEGEYLATTQPARCLVDFYTVE